MGPVYGLLDQHGAQRLGEEYLADGSFQLNVVVKESVVEQLQAELLNATSGTVSLSKRDHAA